MFFSLEMALVIGLGIIALFYFIMIYNHLVALKKAIMKHWANIDVILKQRNDELPKLIAVCQQYMGYEKSTLSAITQARQAGMQALQKNDIVTLGQAESVLASQLPKLFALAEAYPELKANSGFSQLQLRISDLENTLADRREVYNDSVNINNTKIEQFPDLLVAKTFGFKEAKLLEFSKQDLEDVDVNQLFKS